MRRMVEARAYVSGQAPADAIPRVGGRAAVTTMWKRSWNARTSEQPRGTALTWHWPSLVGFE